MNEKDAGKDMDLVLRSRCPRVNKDKLPHQASPTGQRQPRLWGPSARPERALEEGEPEARPREPTILEGGGDDFLRRRPGPGPVARLHHQAVLGELIQVVQGVNLTVPSGVDTDDVELEVAPSAVLAVTYLVASDNPILQMFLGSLNGKEKNTLKNSGQEGPRTHPSVRETKWDNHGDTSHRRSHGNRTSGSPARREGLLLAKAPPLPGLVRQPSPQPRDTGGHTSVGQRGIWHQSLRSVPPACCQGRLL